MSWNVRGLNASNKTYRIKKISKLFKRPKCLVTCMLKQLRNGQLESLYICNLWELREVFLLSGILRLFMENLLGSIITSK